MSLLPLSAHLHHPRTQAHSSSSGIATHGTRQPGHSFATAPSRSRSAIMARAPESAREHVPQNYEDYEDYEQEGEEVFYYDEEDEDDYGPGVVVVEAEAPEPEPQTDLADEAYQDPLALVHAWEGALQDYKVRLEVLHYRRRGRD